MSKQGETIVGLGEILWDLLPTGALLGGAPANFAYHAAALGAHAHTVSAVGDDELGRAALQYLGEHELDIATIAIDPVHPTGAVDVVLDAAKQAQYVFRSDVAWDFLTWNESLAQLAAECDAVCFGTLGQRHPQSRATIQQFLKQTHENCIKILDLNLRAPHFTQEVIVGSLQQAQILKLNQDELERLPQLLGLSLNHEELFEYLFTTYHLHQICVTRGPEGAWLLTRTERYTCPAHAPRQLVDTIGAGDSFTAALVVGTLRGWPLSVVGDTASRLAAYVCGHAGAMPDMHDFQ